MRSVVVDYAPATVSPALRPVAPRRIWIVWLQVVLAVVFAYALFLVLAGSAAESLFSAFGFGPPESMGADARDYLRLPVMVLGAVLAGWSLLMLQIARGPLRVGDPWAWPFLARSVAVWFVLDTGMSLVLGFPAHALFNVPFGVALAVPLIGLRPSGVRWPQGPEDRR